MNVSKARPAGRDGACQFTRPFLRYAALCAAVFACLGAAHAQAQAQVTANYREADIRMVAEQVQQVIGRQLRMKRQVDHLGFIWVGLKIDLEKPVEEIILG